MFFFLEQVLSRVDGAKLQSLLGSDGPGRGRQRGRQNHQVSIMCRNCHTQIFLRKITFRLNFLACVSVKCINTLLILTFFFLFFFFFFFFIFLYFYSLAVKCLMDILSAIPTKSQKDTGANIFPAKALFAFCFALFYTNFVTVFFSIISQQTDRCICKCSLKTPTSASGPLICCCDGWRRCRQKALPSSASPMTPTTRRIISPSGFNCFPRGSRIAGTILFFIFVILFGW